MGRGPTSRVHSDIAERIDELAARWRCAEVPSRVGDAIVWVSQLGTPLRDRPEGDEVPALIVGRGVHVLELADESREPRRGALFDEARPLAVLPRDLMDSLEGVKKTGSVLVSEC